MNIIFFIPWLVAVLSLNTLATLNNEKLYLANYAYHKAQENNINTVKFVRLIECESQFNKNAKGDFRSEDKTFLANGILQFWRSTWNIQADIYGFKKKDYLDPHKQIELAALMIKEKDGWRHWFNCGRSVGFQ